jgi:hypothetical protein
MKSRNETVEFIQNQMGAGSPEVDKRKNGRHHYGWVELRDLMDFLYGPMKSEDKPLVNPEGGYKY